MNTSPSEIYQEMIAGIDDQECRQVADVMRSYIGEENGARIEEIAVAAYGDDSESHKRRLREVIERLVEEYAYPICAISGKAGRWLAATKDEAEAAARELERRSDRLRERARKLRMARLPGRMPEPAAKNLRLWS
jgi:hypothetical protein